MCGRYALAKNLAEIVAAFRAKQGHKGLWEWEGAYNIAPTRIVPVIAWDGRRQRKIVPMRWGLHPHWKKGPPEGRPLFNARVETAHEKPSFRTPFRRRRALIPVTGWYEWEGVEGVRVPHFIHENHSRENASPDVFALAGVWDQWRVEDGVTLLSMSILTTRAVGAIKHIHHRMPVRLPREMWDDWLDWDQDPARLLKDMKGGEDLSHYTVSSAVNSGRANGPELIQKA